MIFSSNSFLSDGSLNGYKISKTLPEPRHYNYFDHNPILAILADQISESRTIADSLRRVDVMLNEIIKGLKNGTITFPNNTKLLPMDMWIQRMESDMSFYVSFARYADEFKAFDDQLIQIAANYLKSPITLIPFPTGEPKVIQPMSETISTTQFYILLCNTAFDNSFAVSIYPEEKPSI